MELILCDTITDSGLIAQIREMMIAGDREFIPPLSQRFSVTQGDLSGGETGSIEPYLQDMLEQKILLAMDGETLAGFMSYRENHVAGCVTELPNLYISTSIIRPQYRGQGMMGTFYTTLIQAYSGCSLYTRTWGTHWGHIHILERLGFSLIQRIPDHRGPGIDTVYFCRKPDAARERQ